MFALVCFFVRLLASSFKSARRLRPDEIRVLPAKNTEDLLKSYEDLLKSIEDLIKSIFGLRNPQTQS